MRIATRLKITANVTLVSLGVLLPILVWVFVQFQGARSDYALAEAIRNSFFERSSFKDQYFLYREERVRRQWEANKELSDKLIAKASAQFHNAAEQQTLALLGRQIDDTATIFHRIVSDTEILKSSASNREIYQELDKRLYSQLLLKASMVRDTTTSLMELCAARAEKSYLYLSVMVGLFALALSFFTILSSARLSRLIRKRLAPLHDGAQIVAGGNLEHRIVIRGDDEFSELAMAFNAMADKLNAEINQHKKSEAALLKVQVLLNEIEQMGKAGGWEFYTDTGKVVWTQEMYSLHEVGAKFSLTLDAVLGFYSAPSKPIVSQAVNKCAQEGTPFDLELEIITAQGRLRNVHVMGKADPEHCRVYGFFQDISERKSAERALRESEARFRAMVENELLGISIIKDRIVQWANPALERMLGYAKGELAGVSLRQLYFSEEDYRMLGENVYPVLDAGKIYRVEIEHKRKDGARIWMDMSGIMLDKEKGEYLLEYVDTTERVKSERELKRSNSELEQFSYAISHDMRQPLRMISSYLQLMKMGLGDKLDETNSEYFKYAIQGAQRLDRMLLDMLDYSRVGRKNDPFVSVDSRALLDETIMFINPLIVESKTSIAIEGEWPQVKVSHNEMQRLLHNLIDNAVKYRKAGHEPHIKISSQVRGGLWRLCIQDDGIGINPSQIGRLFQMFQRLQSYANYEGNGIGLVLCRKIAEHHGGRIWAESAGEGMGSTFCVEIPLQNEIGAP